MGPSGVVITGVKEGAYLTNVIAERDREAAFCRSLRGRPGTARHRRCLFRNCGGGGGKRLVPYRCGEESGAFCQTAHLKIRGVDVPVQNGVCFEEVLAELIKWK